jgi:hypothetical protein
LTIHSSEKVDSYTREYQGTVESVFVTSLRLSRVSHSISGLRSDTSAVKVGFLNISTWKFAQELLIVEYDQVFPTDSRLMVYEPRCVSAGSTSSRLIDQ